jgi:neutral ceramidase
MTRDPVVVAVFFAAVGAAGCSPIYHERPLPTPVSQPPAPSTMRLRAGFAKVDFTPPPGVGLAGNGPDGLRSDGWRLHLFARALVLEDPSGERLAFVVVDLAHVSASLHREVAARIVAETGIGADRLIIGATHTHSGPSHFYAEKAYNAQSSRVDGYDPEVERFLVARIAEAVRTAANSLHEAWAGWSIGSVDHLTRNRSVTAYCRNDMTAAPVDCSGLDSAAVASRALDRRLMVLRIDTLPPPNDPSSALDRAPASFLAVYAIHSTGNSNSSTLLDGDIHGFVMDRLEREWLGSGKSVGLLFNGTEGDASPAVDVRARCPRPGLGIAGPVTLLRGTDRRYDFIRGTARRLENCLRFANAEVVRVGGALAAALRSQVAAMTAGQINPWLAVRRAFATLPLASDSMLCPNAGVGAAALGGAEDAQTRVWKWEPLAPFLTLGFKEGSVRDPPKGCHGAKRQLETLQTIVTGTRGLPEVAQVTVARVGNNVAVAAVPAEVTFMAGLQMRRAIATGLGGPEAAAEQVVVIGLANGFFQYINTDREYQAQSYEGGSNLYGPASAAFLARALGRLAAALTPAGPSPPATVGPITAFPGAPRSIMAESIHKVWRGKRGLSIGCHRGAIRATWKDQAPGQIRPWTGETLVEFSSPGGTRAADGDRDVAIRALETHRNGSSDWEAVWTPSQLPAGATVRLTAQRGFVEETATLDKSCARH